MVSWFYQSLDPSMAQLLIDIVENLAVHEEIVKAGQFTTEDIRGYFQALTTIEQNHRIEWGGSTYHVQTAKKQRHKDRILWVEVLARKVVG